MSNALTPENSQFAQDQFQVLMLWQKTWKEMEKFPQDIKISNVEKTSVGGKCERTEKWGKRTERTRWGG